MMVDDQVLTLTERINGCMRRSMNGKDLPPDSREMEAIIAYLKFVGKGTPEGVRAPRHGAEAARDAAIAARRAARGRRSMPSCAPTVTRTTARASRARSPGIGYSIPPLWGDASFNAGAGMAKTAYAAAYIRDNMPFGISYLSIRC